MKSKRLFLVLAVCGLASTAAGGVLVRVDGQVGEEVMLKVGQTAVVWVSSDDSAPYSAYVGFDGGTAVTGTLDSPLIYTAAGNLASVSAVSPPPITGYYVNAAGASPAPSAGVHFRLIYTAAAEGEATLKLYESTLSVVLQSITIRVEGAAAGTGFTYQGRLLDEDKAANGFFDLQFELFDAPSAGKRIGGVVDLEDVSVQDGYFTIRLDFGDVFGEQARWLRTSVRPGGSGRRHTHLSPRQRITPAPQATYAGSAKHAEHADEASGVHWANVAGIPAGVANYVAPNIQTGYVPYYDGLQLVSSPLRSDGQQAGLGKSPDISYKLSVYTNSNSYGMSVTNRRMGEDHNYGISGESNGDTTGSSYGVHGCSSSWSGHNYGVYGLANTACKGVNFGVYGRAANPSGSEVAFAGWFEGVTILNGDVGIGTSDIPTGRRINTSTGAFLSTGGVWTNSSSRDWKENFEAVDGREVLERLVRVPVSTWNYKSEDASVRHMGPMSQDLYAAFNLSGDDESIATVDTAGLSFAAIQGLYEMVAEKEAVIAVVRQENESLRDENEEIKRRLAAIEARLAALAGQI
ncbi:MAG: tail fiber domain-containing protein [Phycisphaerae bacterium]|nr:tail fiber domain-containing protein [Phycisphaerae bacterium]